MDSFHVRLQPCSCRVRRGDDESVRHNYERRGKRHRGAAVRPIQRRTKIPPDPSEFLAAWYEPQHCGDFDPQHNQVTCREPVQLSVRWFSRLHRTCRGERAKAYRPSSASTDLGTARTRGASSPPSLRTVSAFDSREDGPLGSRRSIRIRRSFGPSVQRSLGNHARALSVPRRSMTMCRGNASRFRRAAANERPTAAGQRFAVSSPIRNVAMTLTRPALPRDRWIRRPHAHDEHQRARSVSLDGLFLADSFYNCDH